MCKKERDYDKAPRIEMCRNCRGAGMIRVDDASTPSMCPVCGGSGRVKKTVKIHLVVEPYTGDLHTLK
jgi:DnaJ-class molecular chaperone